MAKYDLDRIAALAAGSLPPEEAAVLEAAIAADPRAAAELAAQRLALQAVRRAPAPVLSADERAELRRAVAAALHLDRSPQPVTAISRRRMNWRPLALAGAALAALVAAVPLFGLLSVGEGDRAALTTAALEASAPSTTTGDYAAAEGDDAEILSGVAGQTPEATLAESLATTTVPATARALTDADKAVADLVAAPAALFSTAAPAAPIPCLAEARILLRHDDPLGFDLPREAGALAVWFLSEDGATVSRLVAFDPSSCDFLAAYP
ncbi:MAG: hypothetical protein FJW79_04140 [Actinobacteria bacterium]|nr:hypothetical protein [Actinomycetota bacterium]